MHTYEVGIIVALLTTKRGARYGYVRLITDDGQETDEELFFSPLGMRGTRADFDLFRRPQVVVGLVSRRIRNRVEKWDRLRLGDRIMFYAKPNTKAHQRGTRHVEAWAPEADWQVAATAAYYS